jgi:hypothetical protein
MIRAGFKKMEPAFFGQAVIYSIKSTLFSDKLTDITDKKQQ